MKQIIKKQVSIHPLDMRLNPCRASSASLQLEVYHTDKNPKKNVVALNNYSKTFSYQIGDTVDVAEKVVVNRWCWLTNTVKSAFLVNYLNKSNQYW